MAGSKGGKRSKNKGKSKNTNKKKPDSAQTSNKHPDGPIDFKDNSPPPNVNSASAKDRSKYAENELEEQLYAKVEGVYAKARDWLLKSGYSNEQVGTAILNAGTIHGPADLMSNILTNSISFIEKKFEKKRDAFKDMGELYKYTLDVLVSSVMQARLYKQRSEAMYHLLDAHWGSVPSTNMTSRSQRGDQNLNSSCIHESEASCSHNKNEDVGAVDSSFAVEAVSSKLDIGPSSKKVGLLERINLPPALSSHLRKSVHSLTEAVRREFGAIIIKQQGSPRTGGRLAEVDIMTTDDFHTRLEGWLESDSDDPKTEVILDLVEEIRDLQDLVKEEKEWAVQKVIDSARRLSKDLLELKMLRMDVKIERSKYEKMVDSSCTSKLMEAEKFLQRVNLEASSVAEAVKRLETANGQIRADIEALKLSASESERQLKEVLKRERKYMKRVADIGKQTSILRSQCEEEEQRVLQLELELLQAEKETKEIEIRWRQEIREREHMSALLAEETKLAIVRKENSRRQLKNLRQKVQRDCQLERDSCHRLEDELSHLQSRQMPNLPEDESIFYDSFEASSSRSSAHWDCVICLENEVSVVFLPCQHQVMCFPCYIQSCSTVGARCPHCLAEIKESIRVYGPGS